MRKWQKNWIESKEDPAKLIYKFEERFANDVVIKFKVSKSRIEFKIALCRLIDEYPKIKNSLLSLHCFKKYLKLVKEVCKESVSEFK